MTADYAPPGSAAPDDLIVPFAPLDQMQREPQADSEARDESERWSFWQQQINAALMYERRWRVEAEEAERLYFGADDDPGQLGEFDRKRNTAVSDKAALIHANVETLKPLLFSETPQPVVRRRFYGDGKDDEVALMAAEVGQRLAVYLLDMTDFDNAIKKARDDWLIAGRGAVRIRYEADIEVVPVEVAPGVIVEQEVKADERVQPCYVEWRRLVMAPGSWGAMPWLAMEVPMTRRQVERRFGKEIAAQVSYGRAGLVGKLRAMGDDDRAGNGLTLTGETGEPAPSPFDTVAVWEIWNREDRTVLWWSPGFRAGVLEEGPPPLDMEQFWPMPQPLLATTKGESLTPRPDITYYESLASEVDKAGNKLRTVLDALSISGMFPGEHVEEIKRLFDGKSKLIPVASWAAMRDKIGSGGLVEWLPLAPMVAAIQSLVTLREQAKQAMFEASGVSDIMRAQGNPNETATAQQIKGRYAGLRLADRQRVMAIFARDVLKQMIEVALEMFDTDRLAKICGLDLPMTEAERMAMVEQQQQAAAAHAVAVQAAQAMQMEPPPAPKFDRVPEASWESVHARLRTDFGRAITLLIETQSTVLADEQADKEARIEFLAVFSGFVQQLAPLLASGRFDFKVVKELLLFGVRGFPKSRTLEGMISGLPDEPQGSPPEDVQVQVAKIRAEVDRMIAEMRAASDEKDRQHEARMKGVDLLAQGAKIGTGVDGLAPGMA